ncbi:MAG TPA: hypothetical protein VFE61_16445 [Candidatus Sulfotelmatobacter sp.]|nr:hypothetical protein [Candidatus Sulfotelmatobacter sp.]
MSPDHVKDERFEQLCALAAIGELSASEFAELNEHLAGCANCQELYSDFRRITSNELGAVAAGRRIADGATDLDEPALLSGVLERAHAETIASASPPALRPIHSERRPLLVGIWSVLHRPIVATASLTALLCVAVGIAAYSLRDREPSISEAPLNSPPTVTEPDVKTAAAPVFSPSVVAQQSQSERDSLQRSLAEARRDYSEMLNRDNVLKTQLADAKEQLEKQGYELQKANASAQQSETSTRELESRLQEALGRTQAQATLLDQLQLKLQRAEQATVRADAKGVRDADAREVFGARDLHIVDVYDVDGNGKTKRSFGRVYFVEKKLLLFYAFDLQDKQRQRVASAFQAWGYRQGNEDTPQNLGLFLMDDPAISRWMLKVNDARVLERIDAVFVTLEPPNGSPSPRGRKLLYANLGGPPNHP